MSTCCWSLNTTQASISLNPNNAKRISGSFMDLFIIFFLFPFVVGEALRRNTPLFMFQNWFHTSLTVCSAKSGHDVSLSHLLEEIYKINTFSSWRASACLHAERLAAPQVKNIEPQANHSLTQPQPARPLHSEEIRQGISGDGAGRLDILWEESALSTF